jgi:phosphatidate cytidylyltransferase
VLGQRILTAVVLLAVLLPAMIASRSEPFVLHAGLHRRRRLEWARLNGLPGRPARWRWPGRRRRWGPFVVRGLDTQRAGARAAAAALAWVAGGARLRLARRRPGPGRHGAGVAHRCGRARRCGWRGWAS